MSAADRSLFLELTEALVSTSAEHGANVRALGGVAVALRCPAAQPPAPLARSFSDADVAVCRKHVKGLEDACRELELAPAKRFNATHGSHRMRFDLDENRHVDVFVDRFRLCHELALERRLDRPGTTIPLEDLLLTKLQVARLDHKDLLDIVALLVDHDFGDGDHQIGSAYLIELLSSDWGWWRTSTETLQTASFHLGSLHLPEAIAQRARDQIALLQEKIEEHPKTSKWRWRAKIGERLSWREDPEEL